MSRAHPIIQPQPLQRLCEPFDHPDWLYELKYDSFRSLCYIDNDSCRLISRNGTSSQLPRTHGMKGTYVCRTRR